MFDEQKTTKQNNQQAPRPLPSFIDVFFYPISLPGLTVLAVYVFAPVFLHLVESWFDTFFRSFHLLLKPAQMLFAVINLIVTVYFLWYFNKCIRQSALGKTRAPETLSTEVGESIVEMALQLFRISCCLLVCLVPAIAYYSISEHSDWICWLLLVCGISLLPMALLATAMFESLGALNPILIITSICTTFLRYCLVWLTLCVLLAIMLALMVYLPGHADKIIGFILRSIYAYLLLVAAHILGRFYYSNERQLYWPV
ncbi:MAG: hypothetical protein ACYTFK_07490 [Planctomycetota bacterium]